MKETDNLETKLKIIGMIAFTGIALHITSESLQSKAERKAHYEEKISEYSLYKQNLILDSTRLHNEVYFPPEYTLGINAAHYDAQFIPGANGRYMNPECIKILENYKKEINRVQRKIYRMADKYNK